MGVVDRLTTWWRGGALKDAAAEGSARQSWAVSEWGSPFSIQFGDGFQRNLAFVDSHNARHVATAYACVMAAARAGSQCYAAHKYVNPQTRKHETVLTSPFAFLLRAPNDYETFNQFIFNVIAAIGFDGECIVLIVRDARGAPAALHRIPRGSAMARVEPESGAIFYSIGADPLALEGPAGAVLAPARDVIHFRQYTPRHPLIGESPIAAAALALGINVALSQTQAAFFENMARPSGILSTDQALNKDQMTKLREAFKEQSVGWSRGEIPILANGLKFQPLAVNSVDAELINSQRMSVEEIARAFGVPLPIIGDLSKATMNNTEQLINLWLSMSLGSTLENIERSFDKAFGFGPADYVELDTDALLRTDTLARIEAKTKGIQGGLFTLNEARESEGLDPKGAAGDEPLLQSQMTPLSKLGQAPPAPPPGPPGPPPGNDTPPAPPAKAFDGALAASLVRQSITARMAAAHVP